MSAVSVDQLISSRFLRPAYQPIVDLDSRATVGYEALARWPDLGVGPKLAFSLATGNGGLNDLDWACQTQALRGALEAGIGHSATLFVNAEPSSFTRHAPDDLADVSAQAAQSLRVVIEVTERAILKAPAELLRTIRDIRERGWGVALDDVGAVPDSLALLPFIAPDVIKLDLDLVQQWPDADQAKIMAAVMAHAERTGATILAEGIETDAHLEQAKALGATLGQGWYFAAPGPLERAPTGDHGVELVEPPPPPPATPFSLVEHARPLRTGRKGLLLGISRHLENQGMGLAIPPVVLAAFQHAGEFNAATRRRYARLAGHCPLVAVIGEDLDAHPAPGVRGATMRPSDPLRGEWSVVVVGAHYTGALVARDLGDSGPDLQRRFVFVVTHDRDLVLGAARSMIERLATA